MPSEFKAPGGGLCSCSTAGLHHACIKPVTIRLINCADHKQGCKIFASDQYMACPYGPTTTSQEKYKGERDRRSVLRSQSGWARIVRQTVSPFAGSQQQLEAWALDLGPTINTLLTSRQHITTTQKGQYDVTRALPTACQVELNLTPQVLALQATYTCSAVRRPCRGLVLMSDYITND